MKKLVFIITLLIPLLGGRDAMHGDAMHCVSTSAEQRTLTVYTKANCNNCKYTKNMLQKNHIAFREFPLEERTNGAEMMKKLKAAGYADRIYLPVIFEDDSLILHPKIPHNDSTLYFVIQKIVAEKEFYASSDGVETRHALSLHPGDEDPASEEEGGDCDIPMEEIGL